MADDEATEKESIISNLDLEIHINGSITSKVSSQKSKRKLTLFAIGMIFLVLIISIPMATKPSSKMYANNETCLTAECKKAAKLILSSMDESIDPCTDFYNFACGGFIKSNVSGLRFDEISKSNMDAIKKMLEVNPDPEDGAKATSKVRNFYKSCLAKETEPTDEFMKSEIEKAGGWRWIGDNSSFNFQQRVKKTIQMGGQGLFSWMVMEQAGRKRLAIINGANEAALTRTENDFEAITSIANLLKRLNRKNETSFMEAVRNMTAFEQDLLKINSLDEGLELYNISQLSTMYPFLNWEDFFDDLFTQVELTSPINQTTEVLVEEHFLQELNKLVLKYLENQKEKILDDYMVFRFLANYYESLQSFLGIFASSNKTENCIVGTEMSFPSIVTSMVIQEKGLEGSKEAQETVFDMVKIIKHVFIENLPQWMSQEAREIARVKIDHMESIVGHPPHQIDENWLNQEFEELSINDDSFYQNVLRLDHFTQKKFLKDYLKGPVRGVETGFMSHYPFLTNTNAFYDPTTNKITIPFGAMQPPLFWTNTKSLTFGGIGFVIAHEITHGFDNTGILFDSHGNLNLEFDLSTMIAFDNASNCIHQQYSAYSINGMKVDANLTLGENIADQGGLRFTEIAYENWLSKNSWSDATLPGLEHFTHRQLFYLGYAMPWCAAYGRDALEAQMLVDTHSPEEFRINGPLSNSARFSETWSCKSGSPMNPKNKCSIWGK